MKTASQDSSVIGTEDTDEKDPPKHLNVTIIPHPHELLPEQECLLKIFPWLVDMKRFFISEVPITSITVLDEMMDLYLKYVTVSITECLSTPNRTTKLKISISNFMMLCHMTYSEFKLPYEHSSYLEKMSELMAIYLDMVINTFRTSTKSLAIIASKVTSSFHVYFGKNYDYVLEAILKSNIINSKNCWELCDLIFRRVLRDTPGSSLYVMSYVRYLLVFKIWKGVMMFADDRRMITKLATLKLQPPPGFREKLSACSLRDVLPQIPNSRTDITRFLMLAKYSVKDKVKLFLKAAADPKVYCSLDHQNFILEKDYFSKLDGKDTNLSHRAIHRKRKELRKKLAMQIQNDFPVKKIPPFIGMGANVSNVSLTPDTWTIIESNRGDSKRDIGQLSGITEGSDHDKLKRLNHGSFNFKSQLKKKKLFESLHIGDIGEDDTFCTNICDTEIKPEDKEEMEVKDVIEEKEVPEIKVEIQEEVYSMQCVGDEINEVDNEIELPSSPSEDVDVCIVKPEEPYNALSKDAMKPSVINEKKMFLEYIERENINILQEDTLKSDKEVIEVQSNCRLTLRPWLAILKPFVEVPPRQPKCQHLWNQMDGVQYEGDEINEVDNEVELPSSPSEEIDVCTIKPEEPHPSQSKDATIYSSVWGLQDFHSYCNNAGFDSTNCKPNEFDPAKTPDKMEQDFDKDDHSIEELQTCNSVEGDSSEIYEFTPIISSKHAIEDIQALRAAEILYRKPSSVNEKNTSFEYIERKKHNILHEDTLKCDEEIIEVQLKCRSYVKKLTLRPWLAILKPFVEIHPRQLKSRRCWCSTCKSTLNLINKAWFKQWDIIKDEKFDENDSVDVTILEALKRTIEIVKCNNYIWENILEEVVKKIEELIREDSEHYSLPLKKRKTPFSLSNYIKEEKVVSDEESEMSYPSTPMMSIADTLEKLEKMDQKGRYSCTYNINHSVNSSRPMNYIPNFTSQANNLKPFDIKFDHTKYDISPSECKNISEEILLPAEFSTSFITDSQEQKKFKTPAQLKEYQHFSVPQYVINFAHTSPRLCNRGRKKQTRKSLKSIRTRR